MRICHENLGVLLPDKKQLSDLWKSTRNILQLNVIDPSGAAQNLMNGLTGVMTHLGNLRNALGDAHGKGVFPPAVSESMAELAINTAAVLSTMIVRRFNQVKDRGQDG